MSALANPTSIQGFGHQVAELAPLIDGHRDLPPNEQDLLDRGSRRILIGLQLRESHDQRVVVDRHLRAFVVVPALGGVVVDDFRALIHNLLPHWGGGPSVVSRLFWHATIAESGSHGTLISYRGYLFAWS